MLNAASAIHIHALTPLSLKHEPGSCLVGAHSSGIKILCGVILLCNCNEGLLSPRVSEKCCCSMDALFFVLSWAWFWMAVPSRALEEPSGIIAALSAAVGNEASIALLFHMAVRGLGKSWWDPSRESKLRNVLKLSCRDTLWCLKEAAEVLCLDVQVGIQDFGGFYPYVFMTQP